MLSGLKLVSNNMPFQKGHKLNSIKGKHWKLTEGTKRKMSLSKKGIIPKNLSSLRTDECNKKRSIALMGKKLSLEHRGKLSQSQKGEKCYNWKGGITKLQLNIRHCFKYRQWRSDVFARDNFTCRECNVKGGQINAHHIKKFYLIIKENILKTLKEAEDCEELWNINNGITVCYNCHKKYKQYDKN